MVVVVAPSYPYRGGIADTTDAFVETLLKQNQKVVVVSFSVLYPKLLFPGKTQFSEEHKTLSYKSVRLINTLNPYSWWKTAKYINLLNPNTVVFRYWSPWLALSYGTIARLLKSKKIAWIDNALPHERKLGDKILLKFFLDKINVIASMSEKVSSTLKVYTKKPIKTLFHPINNRLPDPIDKATAVTTLGLDSKIKHLLFFGIIRPYKGLDILIKSLPTLLKKRPNTQVLVVGEPYESMKHYRALAVSLNVSDYILFHDSFVPNTEIPLWFSACDWVIQPYKSATQSGITPMAIHYSKPTIVTDVGGLAEGITAETGLVSKADPESFGKTLIKALEKSEAFQNPKAFSKLKKEKSWHAFCQEFISDFLS
ncbi:MAG: glycosyltransferase [Flavobacteriaceae bacterium]|nr:glycosyltransferase [Flavobacteriaceae bacterium]